MYSCIFAVCYCLLLQLVIPPCSKCFLVGIVEGEKGDPAKQRQRRLDALKYYKKGRMCVAPVPIAMQMLQLEEVKTGDDSSASKGVHSLNAYWMGTHMCGRTYTR